MAEERKKVLVACDYYLPGSSGGGGLRTIVNMVERLGDRYDFRIVTRNHDGRYDKTPFTTVKTGEWNKVGKAEVFYLPSNEINMSRMRSLIEETDPDAVYITSVC